MILNNMNNRWNEIWAFIFGLLVILEIFGDQVLVKGVEVAGNLDTIFGTTFWPLMDLLYPLASIAVFLLYGRAKGGIRFNTKSILSLFGFLAAIVIMQFDDFFVVFRNTITLPGLYWTLARLVYLFAATGTFFAFGSACSRQAEDIHKRLNP